MTPPKSVPREFVSRGSSVIRIAGSLYSCIWLCLESPKAFLDRVSTGSDSDLVKRWESGIVKKSRVLITDQVATAPCTDPIQVAIPTLRQSPCKLFVQFCGPVCNCALELVKVVVEEVSGAGDHD